MPVRHRIEKSKRLIIQTAHGEISFSDVQQSRHKMLNDPDFDPSFDMLWDATTGTSINISSNQIIFLAQSRVLLNTSRIAFVAPRSPVFGVARMFETYYAMLHNPAETRVFRHRTEALEWLTKPRTTEQ